MNGLEVLALSDPQARMFKVLVQETVQRACARGYDHSRFGQCTVSALRLGQDGASITLCAVEVRERGQLAAGDVVRLAP